MNRFSLFLIFGFVLIFNNEAVAIDQSKAARLLEQMKSSDEVMRQKAKEAYDQLIENELLAILAGLERIEGVLKEIQVVSAELDGTLKEGMQDCRQKLDAVFDQSSKPDDSIELK